MPENSELESFAAASHDLRFGMLFAGQTETKVRLKAMEARFDSMNNTVRTTMQEGFKEFKTALDIQTLELKPIVKQKEIDDALTARNLERKKDRRELIGVLAGAIMALGVVAGGVAGAVRYFIPAHTVTTVSPSTVNVTPVHQP